MTFIRYSSRFSAAVLVCVLSAGLAVDVTQADELSDQIERALDAYRDKDYGGAMRRLDVAIALLRQKKAEVVADLLPEPLSGWNAGDAQHSIAATPLMAGGITASRTYTRRGENGQDTSVKITLMTDSPLLQSVSILLANPVFADPQSKVMIVAGQKVYYNADDNALQAVVADRALVVVDGSSGVDQSTLKEYFGAIDFEALGKYLR
ncbi:MAG: hypothetical protein JSW10_10135 [Pseudomonadota bacterium]|nr:MAG: hypothetical protein JSW10_10135 [Pseudomonadota bacterium]